MTVSTAAPPRSGSGGEIRASFEKLVAWTPVFVVIYFTAQFVVRLLVSGNLETDEAQFVGQTYFALGYGNSHPPLYNWLVRLALDLTGHWPAAVALVKNTLLAGTYILIYDTARRASGSSVTGLAAAACLALMPQVVWQSQYTLAHSVMVVFGVAATLHALTLIFLQPSRLAYVYLGAAISVGALAKYNFFVFVIATLIVLSLREYRVRISARNAALSFLVFAAAFGPHLFWALSNIDKTTERLSKLERLNTLFGVVDLPYLGIDGILSMGAGLLASTGILLFVWFTLRRLGGKADEPTDGLAAQRQFFARFFGRVAVVSLGLMAIIIFAGDFRVVFERYLTPLILPLTLYLPLAKPLTLRASRNLGALALTVWLAALAALPVLVTYTKDSLAYPYQAVVDRMDVAHLEQIAVLGRIERVAANIVMRLPNAELWSPASSAQYALIVWDSPGEDAPPNLRTLLGDQFQPHSPVQQDRFAYENKSGQTVLVRWRLFKRSDAPGSG